MKKIAVVFCFLGFNFYSSAQFDYYSDPIRLGGTVNSDAEESMPLFSKDSSILYFARTYDASNTGGVSDLDIWYSNRQASGEYTDCKKVENLNNKLNNAVFGISKDGNAIYLLDSYEGKKDLIKGCAISKQKGKGWEMPVHINIPTLDIEGNFYGFHVNETEDVMLISYKGPGTVGEEDLYVSLKQEAGWSAPINLGSTVNTTGFEITPFLSAGKDTLYFSSNGHGGQGDADIFFAVRNDDTWMNWSSPVNLGEKINSAKFDAYFTKSVKQVYWSSNRDGERSDIYYANILTPPAIEISGVPANVSVCNGKDGKIDITLSGGVPPLAIIWSNGEKTEDLSDLKKGSYTVIVTDAVDQTAEFRVVVGENCTPPPPALLVEDDIANASAVIYFDLNSSFLNKDNMASLNDFAKTNAKGSDKFIITAHCDARDSDEYNVWLSKRRLESTIKYLVKKGINRSRLTGEFKGEKEPDIKCTECSEEQFKKNRRTTITVVQ